MKYRKKPVEIEATQWLDLHGGLWPKVERFFRTSISGSSTCKTCERIIYLHGWIKTLEGGHIVCPGDWIITDIQGEYYPCKPDIFEATYDLVK